MWFASKDYIWVLSIYETISNAFIHVLWPLNNDIYLHQREDFFAEYPTTDRYIMCVRACEGAWFSGYVVALSIARSCVRFPDRVLCYFLEQSN